MSTKTVVLTETEHESHHFGEEKFKTPESLKTEHAELHSDLVRIKNSGGEIGKAAEAVAKILHPHFLKEEEYATPPLGLLQAIAANKITPDMKEVFAMTDRIKVGLPEMIEEHKQIVVALKNLIAVAKRNNDPQVEQFAEKLILHAKSEEEVLYPTAILIGEYLKLKLE